MSDLKTTPADASSTAAVDTVPANEPKPAYQLKIDRLKMAKQILNSKLKAKNKSTTTTATATTTTTTPVQLSSNKKSNKNTKTKSTLLETGTLKAKQKIKSKISSQANLLVLNAAATQHVSPAKNKNPTPATNTATPKAVKDLNKTVDILPINVTNKSAKVAKAKECDGLNILEDKVLSLDEQIDLGKKLNLAKRTTQCDNRLNVATATAVNRQRLTTQLSLKGKQLLPVGAKLSLSEEALSNLAKKIQAKAVETMQQEQVKQGNDELKLKQKQRLSNALNEQSSLSNAAHLDVKTNHKDGNSVREKEAQAEKLFPIKNNVESSSVGMNTKSSITKQAQHQQMMKTKLLMPEHQSLVVPTKPNELVAVAAASEKVNANAEQTSTDLQTNKRKQTIEEVNQMNQTLLNSSVSTLTNAAETKTHNSTVYDNGKNMKVLNTDKIAKIDIEAFRRKLIQKTEDMLKTKNTSFQLKAFNDYHNSQHTNTMAAAKVMQQQDNQTKDFVELKSSKTENELKSVQNNTAQHSTEHTTLEDPSSSAKLSTLKKIEVTATDSELNSAIVAAKLKPQVKSIKQTNAIPVVQCKETLTSSSDQPKVVCTTQPNNVNSAQSNHVKLHSSALRQKACRTMKEEAAVDALQACKLNDTKVLTKKQKIVADNAVKCTAKNSSNKMSLDQQTIPTTASTVKEARATATQCLSEEPNYNTTIDVDDRICELILSIDTTMPEERLQSAESKEIKSAPLSAAEFTQLSSDETKQVDQTIAASTAVCNEHLFASNPSTPSNSPDSSETSSLIGFTSVSASNTASSDYKIDNYDYMISSLNNMAGDQVLQQSIMPSTAYSSAITATQQCYSMPLKKRWELTQNQQSEKNPLEQQICDEEASASATLKSQNNTNSDVSLKRKFECDDSTADPTPKKRNCIENQHAQVLDLENEVNAEVRNNVKMINENISKTSLTESFEKVVQKKSIKAKLETNANAAVENPIMENQNSQVATVTKKRGRKKKSMDAVNDSITDASANKRHCIENQNLQVVDAKCENNAVTEQNIDKTENITESEIKVPKKRGRKPKPKVAVNSEDNQSTPNSRTTKQIEADFNPRLLLIRQREQMETDEVLTEHNDEHAAPWQCGLCLAKITKSGWRKHLTTHYGVGWLVGEPPPAINIRSVVLATMITFFKANAMKSMECRMCSKSYRSALGLLQHIETCGLAPQKSICEICSQSFATLSMPMHVRKCYARQRLINTQTSRLSVDAEEQKQEDKANQELNCSGRIKRAAVKKAETIIKAIGKELLSTNEPAEAPVDRKTLIKYVPPLEFDRDSLVEKLAQGETVGCPQSNCCYQITSPSELEKHLANCKFILKPGYHCLLCKRCTRCYKTEQFALKHIKKQHKVKSGDQESEDDSSVCDITSDNESTPDEDDEIEISDIESDELSNEQTDEEFDVENNVLHRSKAYNYDNDQSLSRYYGKRYGNADLMVLRKWKDFVSRNYNTETLFANAVPSYSCRCSNLTNMHDYLPHRNVSMKFCQAETNKCFNKTEATWQDLKLCEGLSLQDGDLFYVGGPITSCIWLPMPANVKDEYLVVCYRKSACEYTPALEQPKPMKTLLLVFRFSNNADTSGQLAREICYAVCIEDGPVHCLATLPSGGYDETIKRLGLLAVGTGQNYVNIYALPLPLQQEEPVNSAFNIINLKSSYVLSMTKDNHQNELFNTQCVNLCWSEFKEHNIIVAGFTNGYVGIWKLEIEGNLNYFNYENKHCFLPMNYFYLGGKNITAMAIHYDDRGLRWLVANSSDRNLNFFDIGCVVRPKIIQREANKFIVRSLDWSPIYSNVLAGLCDAIPNYGRSVITIHPEHGIFRQMKIAGFVSGVSQLHFSPLQNMLACSIDNGDLVFLHVKDLHLDDVITKHSLRLLSMLDLINLSDETDKQQDNFYKYGLVFGPLQKLRTEQNGLISSDARKVSSPLSPLLRVNCLRWNMNANKANTLIAAGYENGFLRIVRVDPESYATKNVDKDSN